MVLFNKDKYLPNLVLTNMLALTPLLAATDNFANAIIMASGLLFVYILHMFGTVLFKTIISDILGEYFILIALNIYTIAFYLLVLSIFPIYAQGASLYIFLLSINFFILNTLQKKLRTLNEFGGYLWYSLMPYVLLLLLLGIIRELLSLGTLSLPTGQQFQFNIALHFSLLRTSAGAFILLGFIAALYRFYLIKRGKII